VATGSGSSNPIPARALAKIARRQHRPNAGKHARQRRRPPPWCLVPLAGPLPGRGRRRPQQGVDLAGVEHKAEPHNQRRPGHRIVALGLKAPPNSRPPASAFGGRRLALRRKFAGAENGPRQLADQKTVPLRDRPARCRRAPPGLVQPAWRCMFDHADLLRRVARPATAQSRTDLGCCSSLFARGQDTAPAVFPAKSPMIITASKRALTAAGSNTSADRPTGSSPRAP